MSLGSKWMWRENLIEWILFFLEPVVFALLWSRNANKAVIDPAVFCCEESEYREYKHNMLPDLARGDVCDPALPAQSGSVTSPLKGFNHRPLRFVPII